MSATVVDGRLGSTGPAETIGRFLQDNPKFGCSLGEALSLLHKAAYAGLGFGVSFHVGSQQWDITAWEQPLATVASLYGQMAERASRPPASTWGVGCRAGTRAPSPTLATYGQAIQRSLGAIRYRIRTPGRNGPLGPVGAGWPIVQQARSSTTGRLSLSDLRIGDGYLM